MTHCYRTALLIVAAIGLLPGCNYERLKALQTNSEPPKTWFATIQNNILGPKCMGCHNPKTHGGELDLSDYEAMMSSGKIKPGNAVASQLFDSVKAGRMPKNAAPLNEQELGTLKAWIDAGASATAPSPEKPAPPVVVEPLPVLEAKYKSIKKLIIDLRCIGCHSGPKPKGELSLVSYKTLTAKLGVITANEPDDSTFYRLLTTDNVEMRMPPKRPPLPDAEIKVIKSWIEAGAEEN